MNKTLKRAVIGFTVSIAGVLSPIVPVDIPIVVENSNWEKTVQYPSFKTETGFLGSMQYAIDSDGKYLVGDEFGYPTKVIILGKLHTEEVKFDDKSVFVNVYRDADTKAQSVVVTEDIENYEKLSKSEISKPQVTERISILEAIVEPEIAEAVSTILPDSYSFSQSSSAVQTVTFAHTVGTADVMVGILGVRDNGGDTPIQVTYNGVDLTQYTSYASSTYNASGWYLVSPSTGTNNVFIDFGVGVATADNHNVSFQSLDNVDTANVINASTTAFGMGTSTATITHLAGSYGLGIRVSNDNSTVGDTLDTNDTVLQTYDAGSFTFWNNEVYLINTGSPLSLTGVENTVTGIGWNADGTSIYFTGSQNDTVFQYECTIPYLATDANCSLLTSLSVAAQDNTPQDFFWLDNGDIFILLGSQNDLLYEFDCSTGYLIDSCSPTGISTSTIPGETTPLGVWFDSTGTHSLVTGSTLDDAGAFTLSTPNDISTYKYVNSTSIGSNPSGISASDDGQFMRIMRPATQFSMYRMSTYFDITTTSQIKQVVPISFLDILTSSGATGIYCKDMTQCLISNNTGDNIYTYEANLTATTTTSGLNTPSQNGDYIYLGLMISPASDTPPATSTSVAPFLIWEE